MDEKRRHAFVDDGSDTTLGLRRLLDELGVRGSPTSFSLTTINAERTKRSGEEVSLTVRALSSDECIQLDRVWTVDKLPVSKKSIPSTEDIRDWPHLQGISIPKLDKEVSILIGNDVPEAHWVFEERRGRRKQPCAARTLSGWTLIRVTSVTDRIGRHEVLLPINRKFNKICDILGSFFLFKSKHKKFRDFLASSEKKKPFKRALDGAYYTVQLLKHDAYCPIKLSN